MIGGGANPLAYKKDSRKRKGSCCKIMQRGRGEVRPHTKVKETIFVGIGLGYGCNINWGAAHSLKSKINGRRADHSAD